MNFKTQVNNYELIIIIDDNDDIYSVIRTDNNGITKAEIYDNQNELLSHFFTTILLELV